MIFFTVTVVFSLLLHGSTGDFTPPQRGENAQTEWLQKVRLFPLRLIDLGAPVTGTFVYCSDCSTAPTADEACAKANAGDELGSYAAVINGRWKCFDPKGTK